MKRFFALIVAAALLLGASEALAQPEKLSVVTTIFPQYDFVRAIAGDRVELTMLLKPGAEVHTYEPTPQDILAISRCDLFVYGGGESDEWAEGLLDSTRNDSREVFALMDHVDLLNEEDEHGDQGDEYDEHVWTSPKNDMVIVGALCDALCALDPDGEAVYRANAQAYIDRLAEVDEAFEQAVSEGTRDTIIFGDRFPFLYFVRDYGLNYVSAFPGCSSETEPSAAKMAELIRKSEEIDAPVIFCLEQSNGDIARAIAEQTGAQTEVFYACHTLTGDDFEAGKTCLDFMWANVESLRRALG